MEKKLRHADLNLLKAFHILLEERNVSSAAERLCVTQSAMSKTLGRLRELFDDPLLVRTPKGLVPTARAEELVAPIAAAIRDISALLETQSFEPQAARGTVRIAAPESFVVGAVCDTILYLRDFAPGLAVESLDLPDDFLDYLAGGKLDFAIYLNESYPEDFTSQPLVDALPEMWFSKKHPLNEKATISLQDICEYPIVAWHSPYLTEEGQAQLLDQISIAGYKPNVLTNTSHPLVALNILMQSDAIMLAPDFLARSVPLNRGVTSRSLQHLPAFSSLKINLSLIQHQRTAGSPLHQWLTTELVKHFSTMISGT